jgi:hypothetical protein
MPGPFSAIALLSVSVSATVRVTSSSGMQDVSFRVTGSKAE